MKISGTVLAGCLLLLFNSAVFSLAQQEKRDEAARPPQQQENKPADARPEQPLPDNPAQEGKPTQEQPNNKEERKDKDQEKQTKEGNKQQQNEEMKRAQKEQGKEQKEQKGQTEQNRASDSGAEREHRQTQRIPDDKFRAHFGREHHFRVSQPVIIDNRPRFQYSGYWFEFVDVWPGGWSYSDDCYVDYIDGQYFLFNVLHPGVRVALVVVF